MILYIAEKPSMALEIAKYLFQENTLEKSTKGYYEKGDYVITWLFGHLLEPFSPVDYCEEWKVWSYKTLPIAPLVWKKKISQTKAKQFQIVKKLIQQASKIINACDPDREGQYLCDEIFTYLNIQKPISRVLLNALDAKSIAYALAPEHMYNNQDFTGLSQSADARLKLDWLIGINYSRLFTLIATSQGYSTTFNVGRVQTPTLSLILRRENEIKTFTPQSYYIIKAIFNTLAGNTFTAQWFSPDEKKQSDRSNQLTDLMAARKILETINQSDRNCLIEKYETVEKKEESPLPFSLSSLQIEASKKYGLKPSDVLEIVQYLYEHKFVTYPRSDCTYIPENQFEDAGIILHNLKICGSKQLKIGVDCADETLKSRAWNSKKISAHHAIIPTPLVCNIDMLDSNQKAIYELIALSYIAQFLPVHEYLQTSIIVNCSNQLFKACGRTVKSNGWKIIFQDPDEESSNELPNMKEGDKVRLFTLASMEEKQTKVPSRYTEGTLLSAMKKIYKHLYDKSLKNVIKDSGLGTEATRAAIIKSLSTNGYVKTDKKNLLIPTEKASILYSLLPSNLLYPDLTAMMEQKLELLAEKQTDISILVDDQLESIKEVVAFNKDKKIALPDDRICPDCRHPIVRKKSKTGTYFWGCINFPKCTKTYPDKNGQPDITPTFLCPLCKSDLIYHKKYDFWGCKNWCNTQNPCPGNFDNKKGKPFIILCPSCKKGYLRKNKDVLYCKYCKYCKSSFSPFSKKKN